MMPRQSAGVAVTCTGSSPGGDCISVHAANETTKAAKTADLINNKFVFIGSALSAPKFRHQMILYKSNLYTERH